MTSPQKSNRFINYPVKHLIVLLAITCISHRMQAQIKDPVHFSYSVNKVKDNIYELHLTATMEPGWHVYAQEQPSDAIAQPTKITFDKNPLITITGKSKEAGKKEKYEDTQAGIVQYQYGGTLDIVQAFTLKTMVKTTISGTIVYQACTDEMCLPPKTIKFNLSL